MRMRGRGSNAHVKHFVPMTLASLGCVCKYWSNTSKQLSRRWWWWWWCRPLRMGDGHIHTDGGSILYTVWHHQWQGGGETRALGPCALQSDVTTIHTSVVGPFLSSTPLVNCSMKLTWLSSHISSHTHFHSIAKPPKSSKTQHVT